jgi:hypothetical protein
MSCTQQVEQDAVPSISAAVMPLGAPSVAAVVSAKAIFRQLSVGSRMTSEKIWIFVQSLGKLE